MKELSDTDFSLEIVELLDASKLGLPTAPEVILKINSTINDDTGRTDVLAEAIAKHPTLAAQLLKVVNSPLLCSGSNITSIPSAIQILGLSLVKDLAIVVALKDMFRVKNAELTDILHGIWNYSVQAGVLSNLMARQLLGCDNSTAQAIGLLHRIGVLCIVDYIDYVKLDPAQFEIVRKQAEVTVTQYLFKKWNLPKVMLEALSKAEGPYTDILEYVTAFLNKDAGFDIGTFISFDEFEKLALEDRSCKAAMSGATS